MTGARGTLALTAVRWRITAEYDDYETAIAAGKEIVRSGQRKYMFQGLKADGSPVISDDDLAFWEQDEWRILWFVLSVSSPTPPCWSVT